MCTISQGVGELENQRGQGQDELEPERPESSVRGREAGAVTHVAGSQTARAGSRRTAPAGPGRARPPRCAAAAPPAPSRPCGPGRAAPAPPAGTCGRADDRPGSAGAARSPSEPRRTHQACSHDGHGAPQAAAQRARGSPSQVCPGVRRAVTGRLHPLTSDHCPHSAGRNAGVPGIN